jgi:hypothetical protein
MVSVLAEETDAPWAVGREGYFIDKYPYDKICLPLRATGDSLHQVIAHEYAHCITLNLAQGRAPRWLDEAVSVTIEGRIDRRAAHAFATGQIPWLNHLNLGSAFMNFANPQARWLAYQQAGIIGHYLAHLKGTKTLGDLMRAFSDNSFWTELIDRLKGEPPVEEALRQVYGFGVKKLFKEALAWHASLPPGSSSN